MDHQARETEVDELAESIAQCYEKVRALAEKWRQENPPDRAKIQQALEPLAERARTLRTLYVGYRERFAPLLEKIAALDLDSLENLHDFGQVSVTPEAARRVCRAMAAGVDDLERIVGEADAFAAGKREDIAFVDFSRIVERLTHEGRELFADLRYILSRLGTFADNQPAPPGETTLSDIRMV